ncbi:MAG TPA: hypothetical protein PKE26_04485 [Kiritimatiellia bacterium]|nr:hypothetical protein [Kiritimatiellia bacterium]HMO98347.1 hypothetical protein [Kiritimatiellia bacterium]HMP95457.1 hypothetical protein [Kiritimatiellia bacterium]
MPTGTDASNWETHLSSLHAPCRQKAIDFFIIQAENNKHECPPATQPGNLHAHTFYSFNCYGYSPTHFALLARRAGMEVAGIVDFDVLDGLMEFHEAGNRLNLRTVVSLETRVMVSSFARRVINSPGEPAIAYHMAAGFTRLPDDIVSRSFLQRLSEQAAQRNREVINRVNHVLKPALIHYEADVLPLTPNQNATERHICQAFARKAAKVIDPEYLAKFWVDKLGSAIAAEDLPESPTLLNRLRARTMKQGGPGYVPPRPESFPSIDDFNQFALACGALPTLAWLDGFSDGESDMDAWLAASGACILNIIPDRNFTPGQPDRKLEKLREVMAWARAMELPVIAGTEMNSYGQKFVDDFAAEELKPFVPVFQEGARIVYAHTVLQRAGGFGYLGHWADRHFPVRADRNAFFAALGAHCEPSREIKLAGITEQTSPDELLRRIDASCVPSIGTF